MKTCKLLYALGLSLATILGTNQVGAFEQPVAIQKFSKEQLEEKLKIAFPPVWYTKSWDFNWDKDLEGLSQKPKLQKAIFSEKTIKECERLHQRYNLNFKIRELPKLIDLIREVDDDLKFDFFESQQSINFFKFLEKNYGFEMSIFSIFGFGDTYKDLKNFIQLAKHPESIRVIKLLNEHYDCSIESIFQTSNVLKIVEDDIMQRELFDEKTIQLYKDLKSKKNLEKMDTVFLDEFLKLSKSDKALITIKKINDNFKMVVGNFDLLTTIGDIANNYKLSKALDDKGFQKFVKQFKEETPISLYELDSLYTIYQKKDDFTTLIKNLKKHYDYKPYSLQALVASSKDKETLQKLFSKECINKFKKLKKERNYEFSLLGLRRFMNLCKGDPYIKLSDNDKFIMKQFEGFYQRDFLLTKSKEIINSKEHSFRKQTNYKETASQLEFLNYAELIKALHILKSLESKKFCNQIGEYIEDDIRDVYGEHGGLVQLLNTGEINLELIPNENTKRRLSEDYSYNSPDGKSTKEYICNFHFHATDIDDTNYSGPSSSYIFGGDLGYARSTGMDGLVFTKLKGKRFNADFYTETSHVIDLGIYSYE